MPERCPHCGRRLDGLMAIHEDKPGLIDSLKGEGGEAWRLFVTVAVCVLTVLIITAAWVMLRNAGA